MWQVVASPAFKPRVNFYEIQARAPGAWNFFLDNSRYSGLFLLQGATVLWWSKWTTSKLRLDGVSLLSISKSRWMRKYDIGNSRVIEVELKEDEAPKNDAIKLPETDAI